MRATAPPDDEREETDGQSTCSENSDASERESPSRDEEWGLTPRLTRWLRLVGFVVERLRLLARLARL